MTAYLSWTLFVHIHQVITVHSFTQLEQISTIHHQQKLDTLNACAVNKDAAPTITITLKQLKNASFYEKIYQELIHQTYEGFPKTRHTESPVLQPFWDVQFALQSHNTPLPYIHFNQAQILFHK